MNDYSVPTRFAFQNVIVKGFIDAVVIVAGAEIIARHERIYGRNQFVFDPKHYLALLEQKPGALDQAAPLQSWNLPEAFQRIRRLLESRMGNRGKTEFIQILRLLEVFEEGSWPPLSCRRCSSARSASMPSSSPCWPALNGVRPGST
jgi:hypothetical protein